MKNQIDTFRKTWNEDQKHFRKVLESGTQHEKSIELFMIQQGVFHVAGVAPEAIWTFEDLLLENLSEEIFRRVPKGAEHSVACLLWHLARCEDITMNLLTAGRPQVLKDWQTKLKISAFDTGNSMASAEVSELSDTIDLEAPRGCRAAVGLATREVVGQLAAEQLKEKVEAERIQDLLDRGIVLPGALGIAE